MNRKITAIVVSVGAAFSVFLGGAGPAAAAGDTVKVELVELICYRQSEGNHDEAYIRWYDAKVWPGGRISYQTMGRGYSRSLSDALPVYIDKADRGVGALTLWDDDSTSGDDRIARFYVGGDEVGLGDRYSVYEDGNAHYVLRYRVVDV